MAQDRSRSAFDVRQPKHWSGVQTQQGRLISDDDWNEADAIAQEDSRRTRTDVIGPSGSPDDGFKVSNPSANAAGIDFTLQPGTLYVGGLRVTLEQPAEAFSLQKDWLQQEAANRPPLGKTDRIDFVYLEAWQQPVTAVEDDELREVALGGPDTSVRVRTMRRVRVLPDIISEDCGAAWTALTNSLGGVSAENERLNDTTLTVGYEPNNGPATNLCSPSAQAGYLGAENQAIRVEIGSGGKTLLWGYDNVSPLYRVQVTNDAQGAQVIHFLTLPNDEAHWPLAHQIVELLPWSAILPNGQKVAETSAGFLTSVTASYDPNTQNVKVAPVVPPTFGTTWQGRADRAFLSTGQDYYYLRVWNRGADLASLPEIPFTVGQPVVLTGTGISVTLAGTTFRQGDFWIIAVRPESPAKVVPWKLESGRLAEGIRRFYAPLGIIHWRPADGQHTFFDCRKTFDPLTRPRGCCVTLSPQPGWEHTIAQAAAAANDLCLCFMPGDFTTNQTVVLKNMRVQVHGAGAASRISGTGLETVLLFSGCTDVEIRDLSIQATAQVQQGKAAPKPHLGGAITLTDCDHITISNLTARCASGPIKSSACIAAYSALPAARVSTSTVRVHGCDLIVGANQVGLSIINYGRTTLTDNSLRVDATENAAIPKFWLQDEAYRRVFLRTLIWHHGVGKAPPGSAPLVLGDNPLWITTAPELLKAWDPVIRLRKFTPGRNVAMNARKFLYELAGDLVYGSGSIGTKPFPVFAKYIANLLALRTVASNIRTIAAQGIVVGGTSAQEVRIVGNTVRDSVQGIHVGTSAAQVSTMAGRVVISNNAVYVTLMPESVTERHGIFVGNCSSLLIENNHIECERLGNAQRLAIDGIRIYGILGRMAYVTRNDMTGVTTGVRVAALNNNNGTDGASSMWRVTENIAHAAASPVDLSLPSGTSTHVTVTGNMS